jgi:hypothetical protein
MFVWRWTGLLFGLALGWGRCQLDPSQGFDETACEDQQRSLSCVQIGDLDCLVVVSCPLCFSLGYPLSFHSGYGVLSWLTSSLGKTVG